jgi:hypothetical protein
MTSQDIPNDLGTSTSKFTRHKDKTRQIAKVLVNRRLQAGTTVNILDQLTETVDAVEIRSVGAIRIRYSC